MEQITLTTPFNTQLLVSQLRVVRILLDWEHAQIQVSLAAPDGRRYDYTYDGATATALMVALNTANLSVKSLHRRVIERLIADHAELSGAISGTPD